MLATRWSPSLTLVTPQACGVLVSLAVLITVQPWLRIKARRAADWTVIMGAPFLSWLTYFFWGANFLLKDGRQYGLPIHIRSFPSAADFLSTYLIIGAAYLSARQVTTSPDRTCSWLAWLESAGFGILLVVEGLLLAVRLQS